MVCGAVNGIIIEDFLELGINKVPIRMYVFMHIMCMKEIRENVNYLVIE